MKIKLDDLTLESYKLNKSDQEKFIDELDQDESIHKSIYSTREAFNLDYIEEEKDFMNKPYFVIKNGIYVGYLHIFGKIGDEISLNYAVHSKFRGQKLGNKILDESSKYIFAKQPDIKKIVLGIQNENEYSINCALESGFTHEETDEKILVYKRFR